MTTYIAPIIPFAIVDANGRATPQFNAYFKTAIEAAAANAVAVAAASSAAAAANAAAATANSAADAAATAAATANTAAGTAQGAADDAIAANSLLGSYPTGLTLTATDAGTSATISISAHTRVYSDGTSVPITAGSVTGLAYSTKFYIYYDDASRTGGTVAFVATTVAATAAQAGDRHTVGSTTTPAALGAPTAGQNVLPPGVGVIP